MVQGHSWPQVCDALSLEALFLVAAMLSPRSTCIRPRAMAQWVPDMQLKLQETCLASPGGEMRRGGNAWKDPVLSISKPVHRDGPPHLIWMTECQETLSSCVGSNTFHTALEQQASLFEEDGVGLQGTRGRTAAPTAWMVTYQACPSSLIEPVPEATLLHGQPANVPTSLGIRDHLVGCP